MAEPEFDGKETVPVQGSNLAAGKTILVDTSLLIELQKADKKALRVREALAPFRFRGVSSYSKLEFKRAWLRPMAYIHTCCCRAETRSVADVWEQIERRLSISFQRRQVQTCLQAMDAFLRAAHRPLSERAELARLRNFSKTRVLEAATALREAVTDEFKGTDCVRAEEVTKEHSDGSLDVMIRRCSPDKIRCQVHLFFTDNAATFALLAEAIGSNDEASEELKTTEHHIRLAQQDATHLCDDRHCAKLADSIIAVDGKKMDVFAANNDKEWITIAKTMTKPLVNPVSGLCYRPD